jgi:hypothetical protein
MMLTVKLESSDFEFLTRSQLDKGTIEIIQKTAQRKYNTVYLQLSKEVAEKILDFLGNQLASKGFNPNGEPTENGLMIEGLIDAFSREIYE